MIGKTILHYKIIEQIGQGGMGVVYLAEDTRLERKVAIKFLPRLIAANPKERKRFEVEAKAAAALNHPNIATIHAIEEAEGDIFIVMEYIEGRELGDIIVGAKFVGAKHSGQPISSEQDDVAGNVGAKHSGQPIVTEHDDVAGNASPLRDHQPDHIPIDQIIHIAIQITEGLQAAHEKGIVHRDIKSSNIMIDGRGRVKIMDFGLAKVRGGMQLTKEHSTLGTAAYMSPEQARGKAVDQRTDVWSFGVVLYEMLTGELPFESEYEQALIYLILNEEPSPVTSLRPEIPFEIEQIIRKALQKEAHHRYGSMKELLDDLENFRRGIRAVPAQALITEPKPAKNSVAVIDFANISGDTAMDWLCGGIAETITVDLKKISALKVVNREKVAKALAPFAGQKIGEEHTLAIGKTLGVQWIVWGGFQKIGQALRITAHFSEVSSGEWIGSAKADGIMEDIFRLQDQIIAALTDTLNLALTPSEIDKIKTPETLDIEAYEYCARARQLFYRFGKSSFEQARELFEQAIAIDPQYALAYSGLGSVHIFRFIGQADVRDLDVGISYLQKAIEYDPDLAEPYLRLTYAYTRRQRLAEAVQTGEKAAALDPENFHAHYFLAAACWFKALQEYELTLAADAVAHLKKTIALQPQFEPARQVIAWIYMQNGRYPEAKEHWEQAAAIEESGKFEGERFVGAFTHLGNWYARNQQPEAALECFQRSLKLLEKSDHFYCDTVRVLTYYYWGALHYHRGQYDEALKLYKTGRELITKNPRALGTGYLLVKIQIWQARSFYKLGMQREAKQSLEAALALFQSRKGYDFNLIWEGNDAQIYYDFAGYYALRHQPQEALEYLRKAVSCGWADLPSLESDEGFTRFREDAEYQKIVQEIKVRMMLL